MKGYMSCEEFAAMHRRHIQTVRLWVRDDKLPGVVADGRRWMIPVDAVPPDDDLTAEQFAAHVGCTVSAVRRWLREGLIEGAYMHPIKTREWRVPHAAAHAPYNDEGALI